MKNVPCLSIMKKDSQCMTMSTIHPELSMTKTNVCDHIQTQVGHMFGLKSTPISYNEVQSIEYSRSMKIYAWLNFPVEKLLVEHHAYWIVSIQML